MVELVKSIGESPLFLFYAFPLAMILGAVHALLPGHGKTIVTGYCIGRKREMGKIIFVTGIAVLTHLFSSALLGVIAMTTSQVLVRNIILPKIQIAAALILILFGLWLLISSRLKKDHHHHQHDNGEHHHHGNEKQEKHGHHSHGKLEALLDQLMSGEPIPFHRYAHLFWLGLAAGMIPCIEPFTLMLFAIALGKISWGFILLLAFGIGVFITMVSLGLLVTSEKLAAKSNNNDNRFFYVAGKMALGFKAVYPFILLTLGTVWIVVTFM